MKSVEIADAKPERPDFKKKSGIAIFITLLLITFIMIP